MSGRRVSSTLDRTADTPLGQSVGPLLRERAGLSGIVPLRDGGDAFAARALLADAAERTLDIRYYIWRNDLSGTLLFDALRRAAERGVRVRLLLDDNNTPGLDGFLAALLAVPNIEVRLFNPFVYRRWRWLNYLTDFRRLNRRMHNKSFTADGQVCIVGGRNVGDEYFDADRHVDFVDLDVLAIGPVVAEVCSDFDRYWSSSCAYPAERILRRLDAAARRNVAAAAAAVSADPAAHGYVAALEHSPFVLDLLAGRLQYVWAPTRMLSDDPAKGSGTAPEHRLLPQRLATIIGEARTSLLLVSPYLVPTRAGVRAFGELIARGVAVTALTNALESTDIALVHSGYAKRRRPMLDAGMHLYELKRSWPRPPGRHRRLRGASRSSLHAKTFAVDGARVFVGSFNFDPRSERLNTEMGFVIESAELAQAFATGFAAGVPAMSYQLRPAGRRGVQWLEQGAAGAIVHRTEPGTSWRQRLAVRLLALLPLDGLL
ncbi:MAG: phospholipase D family protein [Gammaproteobacteria bacterium]|nr:phospholipase D family protein [Gammaproteobacteria bacterium]